MSSLQHRLHLGLATSVVLLMGMLWWLVGGAMQKLGEELVLSRLVHDGESVLAALNVNTDGDVVVWPPSISVLSPAIILLCVWITVAQYFPAPYGMNHY